MREGIQKAFSNVLKMLCSNRSGAHSRILLSALNLNPCNIRIPIRKYQLLHLHNPLSFAYPRIFHYPNAFESSTFTALSILISHQNAPHFFANVTLYSSLIDHSALDGAASSTEPRYSLTSLATFTHPSACSLSSWPALLHPLCPRAVLRIALFCTLSPKCTQRNVCDHFLKMVLMGKTSSKQLLSTTTSRNVLLVSSLPKSILRK